VHLVGHHDQGRRGVPAAGPERRGAAGERDPHPSQRERPDGENGRQSPAYGVLVDVR